MRRSFLAILLVSLLCGCAQAGKKAASNYFIPANYRAAESLMEQLHQHGRLPPRTTLLMGTLVSIDALERSSTLGRLISEQVSARFTQTDYRMVEMKFGKSIYMSQGQGELMLTREIHELADSHSAPAVIVGTYGESRDYLFINLKVIQSNTNVILAVHDYALPMDDNVRAMLRTKRY
jgi:hypothetical protein